MGISDLGSGRAWALGDFLFGLRSAGSLEAVAMPTDRETTSNMLEDYEGALTPARPTIADRMKKITVEMETSLSSAHAASSWVDQKAAHCRVTIGHPLRKLANGKKYRPT